MEMQREGEAPLLFISLSCVLSLGKSREGGGILWNKRGRRGGYNSYQRAAPSPARLAPRGGDARLRAARRRRDKKRKPDARALKDKTAAGDNRRAWNCLLSPGTARATWRARAQRLRTVSARSRVRMK